MGAGLVGGGWDGDPQSPSLTLRLVAPQQQCIAVVDRVCHPACLAAESAANNGMNPSSTSDKMTCNPDSGRPAGHAAVEMILILLI
jgi:hypothetical protein